MRRSILIAMLVMWVQAYLFGPELMRVPGLISHYIEHCDEEQGLTFSSFIAEHYSDAGRDDDGDPNHAGLPYHHHNGSVDNGQTPVYIAQDPHASELDEASGTSIPILPSQADILPGHTSGLIQPPRSIRA